VCPTCEKDSIYSSNAIELAHTFYLGDTYTSIFKTKFLTTNDKVTMSLMGCYGIGLSRMIAAIAQVSHDGLGIIWPESVAPWKCIVLQGKNSRNGEPLYDRIASVLGADNVLLDDRQSLGQRDKQGEAERTGYPYIVMHTPKSETKDQITVIDRLSGSTKVVSSSEISDINFWVRDKVFKA
jgi:prolyl-tRNA synthetase